MRHGTYVLQQNLQSSVVATPSREHIKAPTLPMQLKPAGKLLEHNTTEAHVPQHIQHKTPEVAAAAAAAKLPGVNECGHPNWH